MLNFSITSHGPQECPGEPKVFLNNADLKKLLESQEEQLKFINEFGEGVTVGYLGKQVGDNLYEEKEITVEAPSIPIEGLGFYEKLST